MACSLQPQLFHFSHCNCSCVLLPPNSHLPSQPPPFPCHKRPPSIRLCSSRHETPNNTIKFGGNSNNRPGFSSSGLDRRKSRQNLVKISGSARVEESVDKGAKSDGNSTTRVDSAARRKTRSALSSKRVKDSNSDANSLGMSNSQEDNGKMAGKSGAKGKNTKRSKKTKENPADTKLRVKLEMCSKAGDVMGAIAVYDSAVSEGIELGQYLYTVLLYLCSSAAMGVIQPAKSGSGTRNADMFAPSGMGEENLDRETKSELHNSEGEVEDGENGEEEEDDEEEEENDDDVQNGRHKRAEIHVGESVKKYALQRGFEIYKRMCLENIPMNEATLTSVARMALAMGDGDKAFETVKQMKELGINPKLRSYGPALSMFCSKGDVEKAFEVEKHMLEHGVQPEEPELEALLRVCINVGKSDRIYYLLHKLRATVRSVSPSTADLIEKWFGSKEASRVGKRRWDPKTIVQTMESVGGGWHGQGWLGTGKWSVSHTLVDSDGLCKCCGEKLALIDLDPEETERFAESVAAIASKREKNSSFEKFQRWLDYYGPFEAVVDAANIGLFSQRKFKLSKVRAVVSGIRQMLTSKKWPLVVLHNRRVTGSKMNEPVNRAIIERWKNADALYATPTGSNDDWYWLYAAIKFRCFLVTNDEMRDHIFQLLGNDFFPRWKERHQVRFNFSEVGPLFHMPPPCSVVIQENERGHWHIPIASKHQSVGEITWLCIKRVKPPPAATQDPRSGVKASPRSDGDKTEEHVDVNCKAKGETEDERRLGAKQDQETYGRKINISAGSVYSGSLSILSEIQAAEEKGGNAIDFQI